MSSEITNVSLNARLNDLESQAIINDSRFDETTYIELLKNGSETLITNKTNLCKYNDNHCSRMVQKRPCRFNHSERCAALAKNVLKSLQEQLALTQFEFNYEAIRIADPAILPTVIHFYEQELLNTQTDVVQKKTQSCRTFHFDTKGRLNCPFNHIYDLTTIAQKVLQTRTTPPSLERNTSNESTNSETERVVRIATDDSKGS